MLFHYDRIQDGGKNLSGGWPWGGLPRDSRQAAEVLLSQAPVIDGHIDLPDLVRNLYHNNISSFDLESPMPGEVDIPRLKKGRVGSFFWSVYVDCPGKTEWEEGPEFLWPSWTVRDTLEQIDVAKLLIEKYGDTFEQAFTAANIEDIVRRGKIASLLGVEGGHQLGNSLAVLRQYYALGVRYVTLTHMCHNAFADSGGFIDGIEPVHGGLSPLGHALVHELNRLGMLIDISHVSDSTALQTLDLTRAPVIWSHSSARGVWDVARNVPDFVLQRLGVDRGEGRGAVDGVVMINFYPGFVAEEGKADVKAVADHVEHVANVTGSRKYVGIGSDFDGIPTVPRGLEDVSKYANLVAELHSRGWDKFDLAGFTGANLLRVMHGVEEVARQMRMDGVRPSMEIYEKREDL
ncbi:uncharacterized protein STEHIDRAFT_87915 [Stereum hirsutum FP-91666 SS1]|uniref:Dipeptidase n=1 Tax=Stereum hirsutum (strain FP-91666) TaxID=721885 RepID=R7RYI4_STEHR|nr:uncharacterized protein STEHIDRAFT_87915 [Stereum hirsutum FP-91666 SS1]EIM79965.1 hypothetical protein STEHIDRAFT_87915 [Stereum hirsutum FP-91666 SS1]